MRSVSFEAMVHLGSLNSRMKDFYDLWLFTRRFDFKGKNLVKALKETFDHRKKPLPQGSPLFTKEIYDEKSDRQNLWMAFLRKGRIKQPPEKLSEIAKVIEKFLIKLLEAIDKEQDFNSEWKAPGPWA